MCMKYKLKYNVIIIINLFFLTVYFCQLFAFPNKLSLLGSGILCLIYWCKQKKYHIDISVVLLFLSLFLYTVLADFKLADIVSITILPVTFMLLGKYLIISGRNKNEIWIGIAALVLGFTVHGVLNSFLYFYNGFTEGLGRMWKDIWSGVDLPATHQNVYVLPIISILFPAFLYWKKYKKICLSILLLNIFFLVHAIYSYSRIPILIWGIIIAGEFILFAVLNQNNIKAIKFQSVRIIVGLLMVISLAVLLLKSGLVDTEKIMSTLNRNGGILHNIRFRAQLNALRQLFVYPFGGYKMDLCGLAHCHNVWLDIANAAGVIPFFLMVMYTVFSFLDLFKLLKDPRCSSSLKYVLSGLYFAFVLYYMVEPALMANVNFFVPWTYINGLILGYNIMSKNIC